MTPGRLKIWNDDAQAWEYTPGGGSQPWRVVTMDVDFDTAGLVIPASGPAGIKVCDVAAYEALALTPPDTLMGILVFEAWDGNSPTLRFCTTAGRGNMPGTPPTPFEKVGALSLADTDDSVTGAFRSNMSLDQAALFYFPTATSLYVYVDDENGADPVSTQGSGRLAFVLLDFST